MILGGWVFIIYTTIGSWCSQWVVMAAHHCYLWWRWRSDILWATIIRFYDCTQCYVSFKLSLWRLLCNFIGMCLPIFVLKMTHLWNFSLIQCPKWGWDLSILQVVVVLKLPCKWVLVYFTADFTHSQLNSNINWVTG